MEEIRLQKYLADFSGKEENLVDVIEEYSLPKDYPAFSLWVIFEKLNAKLSFECISSCLSACSIVLILPPSS